MEFISELHTHSKYAAACSEQLTLENMAASSERKGIRLIGTADFSHPAWFKEIKAKLEEETKGVFKLKDSDSETRFVLASEVSVHFSDKSSQSGSLGIFDRTGVVKRWHNCLLAPSIEAVEQINEQLAGFGNLASDGRPQLAMRASELVELMHGISDDIMVYPAHAWTPWFGVFGSLSGFDSIDEAYEDQAKRIQVIETGLSADPAMFWRISKLDKYAVISGGDAHSLPKQGREATVLEFDSMPSYSDIVGQIKSRKFKYTIEFYPEEGKYHYDGHRKCNVSLSPEESAKYNNICPVCGKPLTLGVLNRVNELADREPGYVPKGSIPYVHAVPLQEVLAFVSKKSAYSAYVKSAQAKLIEKFGTEFNVLLKADIESIRGVDRELARAIENIREERVRIKPGYDGVFGVVDVLDSAGGGHAGARRGSGQKTVTEFLQKP